MNLMELLKRKWGPAPVWVYAGTGVLIVAWYIKRRNASKAPQADAQALVDTTNQTFPSANPMSYSQDIFVNVHGPYQPIPGDGGTVSTQPVPSYPPGTPRPSPVPVPRQTSISYVVRPGDTLWDIARRFLGKGTDYSKIYQANKTTIDAAARKHGFANSGEGSKIWAGTKLVIPTS